VGRSAAVFVHGLFSSPDTWSSLQKLLLCDPEVTSVFDLKYYGYSTPALSLNPARRIPGFDTLAIGLGTFLETEVAGYDRIVLVTHSQGGLIAQRYLARMLGERRGAELHRISRVIMFACPHSGSEIALSFRRALTIWRHPQERELRLLTAAVVETQRTVVNRIVHARSASATEWPIAFSVYCGESDNMCPPASARAVFPHIGVLPGGHSSIIRPDSVSHRAYLTLKRELGAGAATPHATAGVGKVAASAPATAASTPATAATQPAPAAAAPTVAAPAVAAPAVAARSAPMSPDGLRAVVEALLQIDDLADVSVRRAIVLELPPHVRSTVRDGSNARTDVIALVRACDRFGDHGRQMLVEALRLLLAEDRLDVGHALRVIETVWTPPSSPEDPGPEP
jgi:pimeloyl-ACP methyl ester carboxylesterase